MVTADGGENEAEMEEMRLNKYLSTMGICSRREADSLIETGKVLVDGQKAVAGMKVSPSQMVECNGKKVGGAAAQKKIKPVLIAVNKPRGIVCTTSDKDRAENIVDFIQYPVRIYPIGRLDKDSEGLLLMTNQGDLVNRIMRAGNYHEKEYEVRVDKKLTEHFLKKMSEGIPILDTVTRPCQIKATGTHTFRIVLTQGLNRQIRRMCEYLGYRVVTLKRIRIMNINLGNLHTGDYRNVTPGEYSQLLELLEDSQSLPFEPVKVDDARCGGTALKRTEHIENRQKAGKLEKPEKLGKPGKLGKPEKLGKPGKSEKPEKTRNPEKFGVWSKSNKLNRQNQSGQSRKSKKRGDETVQDLPNNKRRQMEVSGEKNRHTVCKEWQNGRKNS